MVEEVRNKIEGFDALLDRVKNLSSHHSSTQNLDDASTLDCRCWNMDYPLPVEIG